MSPDLGIHKTCQDSRASEVPLLQCEYSQTLLYLHITTIGLKKYSDIPLLFCLPRAQCRDACRVLKDALWV